MKYIDAEQLKAEIERFNSLVPYENNDRHDEGLHDAYKAVKNVIASLKREQPEVDLEKEIDEWLKADPITDTRYDDYCDEDIKETARHFYGLRNRAIEEAARHVYESWMGGTMDDVRRDMVELGKVLNARKEG